MNRKKKPALTEKDPQPAPIGTIYEAFVKRLTNYSSELVISVVAILFISPIFEYVKGAFSTKGSEATFYVDTVACPAQVMPENSKERICSLLSIVFTGAPKDLDITRISIWPVDEVFSVGASDAEAVQFDKSLLRGFQMLNLEQSRKVSRTEGLRVLVLGKVGRDVAVQATIDGELRNLQKLAIANKELLFILNNWRIILLILIAYLFTTRYRQLAIATISSAKV